jgi:hypothetical protein
MVVSTYKQKCDVLTEENISKVLDEEDESDVFSEDSDDFSFDTCEEDPDSELDTGSVVCESEWGGKSVRFDATFCTPRCVASQIFISWCKWSQCRL